MTRPGQAATPPPPSRRSSAGPLSSSRSFSLPMGRRVEPHGIAGYPIDFSVKASSPSLTPWWLNGPQEPLHVAVFQWGLGSYERYLTEGDERWLEVALEAGRRALETQHRGGRLDGGWLHRSPFKHTFPLGTPWMSAMAQGEGASLLVRLFLETGDEALAEAARRALGPLRVPSGGGGVRAQLGGRPFPEEYPTKPSSYVLNGAIFALWGVRDVAVALDDSEAKAEFESGVDTLAASIDRWDTGYWSRYDLFPHPLVNVASSFYHQLHISQLRAMTVLSPRPALAAAADRFEAYAASPAKRRRAFGAKVLFRLAVPRNRFTAYRLPWSPPRPA